MTFRRIIQWNEERELLKKEYNAGQEYAMLEEELEEFLNATNAETDEEVLHELLDALADIIIVAAGSITKLGFNPTRVMNQALLEIESRVGQVDPETGKFEKSKTKEARANWYTADYTQCQLSK